MLQLYYTPGACSLAAHMLLEELQIPYEIIKVDLKTHTIEKDGSDYYQINPLGSVPVLRLANGEVLTQNAAILMYLGDQDKQHKLLPKPDTMERLRTLEWIGFINSDLHKGFSTFFRPNSFVTSDTSKAELKEKGIKRISDLFNHVEKRLSDKHYVMGENFTVPDAYLFVMYQWAKNLNLPITSWPKYTALVERIAKRPAVEKVLKVEGLIK